MYYRRSDYTATEHDSTQLCAIKAGVKLWELTRIPYGVANGVPAFRKEMNDKMLEIEELKDTIPYFN